MFVTLHQQLWKRPMFAFALIAAVLVLAVLPLDVALAGDKIDKFILQTLGWLLLWLIKLFGLLLVWAVKLLVGVAQYNVFIYSRAVTVGWVVVRDIMNMFFIVILLVIAIGTILRSERFTYKNTLVKLVIMVIMVNFSKTIAGFFIDAANVVMGAFVQAVEGNAEGNLISGFGVADMLSFAETNASGDEILFWDILVSMALALVMSIIAFLVTFVLVLILLARIIALWILVILSPVAFVADILPVTQKYAGQWWEAFTKYLIVGPVLMFFFWLSLIVLSDPTTNNHPVPVLLGSGTTVDVQGGSGADIASAATAITSPQRMFDYVVAIGLLLATLTMAQSMGVAGGSIAGKLHGKVMQLGSAAVTGSLKKVLQGFAFVDRKIGKKTGFGFSVLAESYKGFKERLELNKQRDINAVREKARQRMLDPFAKLEKYTKEDLDKYVADRVQAGDKREDILESDEYKQRKEEVGKYKPGQTVKPGFIRMLQNALMNPEDFMREYGSWNHITSGRTFKAMLPAFLGGGFDPRKQEEEMDRASKERNEAEQKRKKFMTEKNHGKEEKRIKDEQVNLNRALGSMIGAGSPNVNLEHSLEGALQALAPFIQFAEKLEKDIEKARKEETDAKGTPEYDAKKTERIELESKLKQVNDYTSAVQKFSDLRGSKAVFESDRDRLNDERKGLGDAISSSKGSDIDRKNWQKRIDQITKELDQIKHDEEIVDKEMAKANKSGRGHDLSDIFSSMGSELEESAREGFERAFDNIKDSLIEESEKLGEYEYKGIHSDEQISLRTQEENKKLEEVEKEFLKAQRKFSVMRAPSFFHLDAKRRSLEAEAVKTIQTDNWTEYVHAMRSALLRGDKIEFNALFRKAAADGNDNEVFDNFGFYSGAQGAKQFKRVVMQGMLNMGEQMANSTMNDIEYINEKINHWGVARGHRVNELGFYEETPAEDQAIERYIEINKLNNENFLRGGNRLAYGGEVPTYNPISRKWERQFMFEPHGMTMLASNYQTIRSQFGRGRFNTNAAQMMTTSPIAMNQLKEVMRSGMVDRADFQAFINELHMYAASAKTPPLAMLRMMQRQYG